jgi:hypothetical protein
VYQGRAEENAFPHRPFGCVYRPGVRIENRVKVSAGTDKELLCEEHSMQLGNLFVVFCTGASAFLWQAQIGQGFGFGAALEATQGQMGGFFSQLQYKCLL